MGRIITPRLLGAALVLYMIGSRRDPLRKPQTTHLPASTATTVKRGNLHLQLEPTGAAWDNLMQQTWNILLRPSAGDSHNCHHRRWLVHRLINCQCVMTELSWAEDLLLNDTCYLLSLPEQEVRGRERRWKENLNKNISSKAAQQHSDQQEWSVSAYRAQERYLFGCFPPEDLQ